MANQTKFSPEVRERAVRLVQEHRDEYPSLWAAVASIAPKIGCTPTTLLGWVKHPYPDAIQTASAAGGNSVCEQSPQAFQTQDINEIGKYLGTIAHDFNNLLMAVEGNLALLSERVILDQKTARLFAMAKMGLDNSIKLNAQLMDFSRSSVFDDSCSTSALPTKKNKTPNA